MYHLPMASNKLREAVAANLEWLSNIRLTDTIEWVWVMLPAGLSVIVLAALLAFTKAAPVHSLIGSAAHLCFAACLYFAASRHWLALFSFIVLLSEINLLIFSASSAPQISMVLLIYGGIALAAIFAAAWLCRQAQSELIKLDGGSRKDDFRWLVTAAPLALRHRARKVLLDLQEQ